MITWSLVFLFVFSVSLGQKAGDEIKFPSSSKPAAEGGDKVNTRIFGPGFDSLISTGLDIASGISQGLGAGNRPGSFGAFNQPHDASFGRPGAFHSGRPDGFGGGFHHHGVSTVEHGFNRPVNFGGNINRPGFGGNFNRPGSFGDFNRPSGFDGGFNRPGSFGDSFNRPGSFNNGFNRPGSFNNGFNRPGSFNNGFNRPGSFGGDAHLEGFNSGINRPGGFGVHHNRPGSFGSFNNGHSGLNGDFRVDSVNSPGASGFPFTSALTKLGKCPPLRPSCPGNTRIGPVICSFDVDCPTGEKCCPDVCLESKVCKKAR